MSGGGVSEGVNGVDRGIVRGGGKGVLERAWIEGKIGG